MKKVYRNILLNSPNKFILIGKINGLSSEVIQSRKRFIKRKNRKDVSLLWQKRAIGHDTRHHLLAYAFLRGMPYLVVEKNCAEENKPSAKKIIEIALAHLPTHYHPQWTEERVSKWLNGEKV